MTCQQVFVGGQNVIEPVLCGKPAKVRVELKGWQNMCGVHGRFWKARGYTIVPIVKESP